jgi:uncharacterized coiled-coil DUF342 family protein
MLQNLEMSRQRTQQQNTTTMQEDETTTTSSGSSFARRISKLNDDYERVISQITKLKNLIDEMTESRDEKHRILTGCKFSAEQNHDDVQKFRENLVKEIERIDAELEIYQARLEEQEQELNLIERLLALYVS